MSCVCITLTREFKTGLLFDLRAQANAALVSKVSPNHIRSTLHSRWPPIPLYAHNHGTGRALKAALFWVSWAASSGA